MRNLLSALALIVAVAIYGCTRSPELIKVGDRIVEVNRNNGAEVSKVPYRLYDVGPIPKNIDIIDLKLQVQSGRAIGKEVMLHVYECFGPDLRNRLPTVMCSSQSTGDIHLAGDEAIRSKLLHLKPGQVAEIVGRVHSIYGSTPILEVN